jgi:ABC-type uncharacterized transport system substrate-binding protein
VAERAVRLLAAAAALLAAASARSEVVLLTQPAVPQYAQAVEGFHRVSPATLTVDIADEAAVAGALARAPEVVVAVGSKAFEIARARAPQSAVIAAGVLSPDVSGRTDLTAVPMETRAADALEALHALAPDAKSVLALHPPGASQAVAEAQAAAKRSGLDVEFRALADLDGFQGAFRALLRGRDAVWLLPDSRLARPDVVKFMVGACLESRVALVGFLEGMTRAGALASVTADFPSIGRESARLAAELAARPREQRSGVPFRFVAGRISVNDRTREALALSGKPPQRAEVLR